MDPYKHASSSEKKLPASPPTYGAQSAESILPIRNIHACITLNRSDRLRCISFPQVTVAQIREAIVGNWPGGIQEEFDYHSAHEFKLKGYPWSGQGVDAIPSRHMMCTILSSLYHSGWQLVAAADVSKKQYDKDTLFFKAATIPPPCMFFSVSFNEGDKLRLINAPPNIIHAVRSILTGAIQREEWKIADFAYQFKLFGYPWYADGSETVTSRVLLLNMLDALATYGWELHASIDMSLGPGSESSAGRDTESWFFKKYITQ